MAPMSERASPQVQELGFSISHQKVTLDLDLASRSLRGRTEITIDPHSRELRSVRLNCRQCEIKRVTVNGRPCSGLTYEDPYKLLRLPWRAGAHQYHMLQQRLEKQFKYPPVEELTVMFPKSVRIEELDPFSEEAQILLLSQGTGVGKGDVSAGSIDLTQNPKTAIEPLARFTPIQLYIEYTIEHIRDGMQFVGWEEGDLQYPHAYTTNSLAPGAACCLFPCTDSANARCSWEVSIKCHKTVGDALSNAQLKSASNGTNGLSNGINGHHTSGQSIHRSNNFRDEDKALDLTVICTGEITDEVGTSLSSYPSSDSNRLLILKSLRGKPLPSYVPLQSQHSILDLLSGPSSMSTSRNSAKVRRTIA